MQSSMYPVILAFLTIFTLVWLGSIHFPSVGKFKLSYEDVSSYLKNIITNKTSVKETDRNTAPSEEDKKYGFCQRRKFEKGHPFTALSSVPGSGNTWARYLMEQITGK